MNFKILLISFVALLVHQQCQALDGYVLAENNEARLYMATFLKNNGTRAWISCTGVFVHKNYILTAATCVQGDPHSIDPRSGQINVNVVGSGNRHITEQVIFHPDYDTTKPLKNNIALIRVSSPLNSIEELKPQPLGNIVSNRICTMFGWEGHNTNQEIPMPLRMYAVPIAPEKGCDKEAPEAYCTIDGLSSNFKSCGGLMGAPIFCSGGSVSGIVVNDNFCQGADPVGGSFISVGDVKDFINGVLHPVKEYTTPSSALSIALSQLLMLTSAIIIIKNYF